MIVVPATSAGQEASWHALLDLHEVLPEGWVLVGGQMVHLHAAERSYRLVRPTDDADAVLDVKLVPTILHDVTEALVELGFASSGVSASGVEHRWNRGAAQIDLLIPQGLGERLRAQVVGVTGSPTVETPAGQIAVDLSELVDVQVGDRVGHVRRPTLLGALIAKAAADTTVSVSSASAGRHLEDFVTLSAMLKASDLAGTTSTRSQRRYVAKALRRCRHEPICRRSIQARRSASPGSRSGSDKRVLSSPHVANRLAQDQLGEAAREVGRTRGA